MIFYQIYKIQFFSASAENHKKSPIFEKKIRKNWFVSFTSEKLIAEKKNFFE